MCWTALKHCRLQAYSTEAKNLKKYLYDWTWIITSLYVNFDGWRRYQPGKVLTLPEKTKYI